MSNSDRTDTTPKRGPDGGYGWLGHLRPSDQEWVEAVQRADSDTLIGIRRQEDAKWELYQSWAEHFRRRADVITDELARRELEVSDGE